MSFNYQAPGVYINYVTDGPLSVRAASTSTAVFVGKTVVGSSIVSGKAKPVFVTSLADYAEKFSTTGCRSGVVCLPTASNDVSDPMGHAVRGFFMNGGQKAYIVSTSTGTQRNASGILAVTDSTGTKKYRISARSPGKWGNSVAVKAGPSSLGTDYCDIAIELTVAGDDGPVVSAERLTGYPTKAKDGTSNIVNIPSGLAQFEEVSSGTAEATLNVSATTPSTAPVTVALGNGANGDGSEHDIADVFEALKDIDDISLIVLPGRVWRTDNAAYETAISHCQAMKDRMVLVQLADETIDFRNAGVPQDKYASVYFPSARVALRTPGGGVVTRVSGIAGHVAGVFARTDAEKGAWTAPAGMHASIAGITQLTRDISQTAQEGINPHNINAARYKDGMAVVWGARTRDKGGIYEYIPVMRTAFLIADSLRESLNRVVFAKNTEVLWKNVKAGVTGFMDGLYAQGAFQGATPSEAFEVAVGLGQSMTQDDIDKGLLRVTVRFRPAKPAEFVEVSIEQLFATAA